MSDLMRAVEEIREHADEYQLAEEYYEGTVGEVFTSDLVRRALRRATGGFDVNLARRPVDAVLDRVSISALSASDSSAVSEALRSRVWDANQMDRYSKMVHRASLVFGDAYVIAWPGEAENTVELFYNSPVTTRVFYSAENPRVKDFAAKLWLTGHGDKQVVRVNLYYADRIEKWATKPGGEGKQESEFLEYVEDDSEEWPVANPFGVVPVFHFRTDEPYGRPEHAGAFGPQNSLTKLSTTLMATIDYQGFPQRYMLLEQAGALADNVDWDDDDETQIPSSHSELNASPGTVWKLPGASAVGQFNPADVDAFLKPMAMYTRLMASATATPLRFFDPQGAIPSGAALRADEAPLASRIRDREAWWEETWTETLLFAASAAGIPVSDVDIQWAPVQVADGLEDWREIEMKLSLGIPFKQVMVEAGYSASLVDQWIADLAAQSALRATAPEELLGDVKSRADALGSLIRAGVKSESAASQVGLPGVEFSGAIPVTLRPLASDAASLERKTNTNNGD